MTLTDFDALCQQPNEEKLQAFLAMHHHVLLETFGRDHCLPKFRLGTEFVTDFTLHSVSSLGELITLVELEPPTERAFTRRGVYARRLNGALAQINEWLAWIESNRAYFERSLDQALKTRYGWHSGLRDRSFVEAKIIIGRRTTPEDDQRRATVYASTNRLIEITNYDRLLGTIRRMDQRTQAQREDVSASDLHDLGGSDFPDVRLLVARHKRAPTADLMRLAMDPDPRVLDAVIANRHCTATVLDVIAARPDQLGWPSVAEHPHTNWDTLRMLHDTNETLRKMVLIRPDCPEDLLLSALSLPAFRIIAAANRNLAVPAALEELADDSDFRIRIRVARNPHLSSAIAARLSQDPHPQVRHAILYENPNTPEHVLVAGAEVEDVWAKRLIAKHPVLSDELTLHNLASDPSPIVRESVAGNPNLSEVLLRTLLTDSEKTVREEAEKSLAKRTDTTHVNASVEDAQ